MSYYAGPIAVIPANTILRFTPHENPPTAVPYELQSYYKEDVWGARITAVTRKASRYYKRGIEWVWLIVSFCALIAAPIAVYYVALHNLPDDDKKDDDKDDHDHDHGFFHTDFDNFWKARLISFGTWVGLMILVFVPMHIWKNKGKKEVNQMLQKWEQEDRAVLPQGASYPTLKMKSIGVLSKAIKIQVAFPASGPSVYQPGMAPPPPMMANNAVGGPGAYYQQQPIPGPPSQPNAWNPPVPSGYPLMPPGMPPQEHRRDSYEQAPAYPNPTGPYGEEKAENPFEDVKV